MELSKIQLSTGNGLLEGQEWNRGVRCLHAQVLTVPALGLCGGELTVVFITLKEMGLLNEEKGNTVKWRRVTSSDMRILLEECSAM